MQRQPAKFACEGCCDAFLPTELHAHEYLCAECLRTLWLDQASDELPDDEEGECEWRSVVARDKLDGLSRAEASVALSWRPSNKKLAQKVDAAAQRLPVGGSAAPVSPRPGLPGAVRRPLRADADTSMEHDEVA